MSDAATLAWIRKICESGELRELRLSRRLSLAEFGASEGLSSPDISRWERGRNLPRSENAFKLARIVDELLEVPA